jgi:SAM-dependent methyltransferase
VRRRGIARSHFPVGAPRTIYPSRMDDDQPRVRFVPLRDRLARSALARALRGCDSVLDVGCGATSPLAATARPRLAIGMDVSTADLRRAQRDGWHHALVRGDVRDVARLFAPASFDAVVALDVIEHLPRDAALRALCDLERVARRRLVVVTPNGFVPQAGTPENPFQEHLCGFTVDDMRERGFAVTGTYGLRVLLGPYAGVRWQPAPLWRRVADLSALATARLPRLAFSLLCVKEVAPR